MGGLYTREWVNPGLAQLVEHLTVVVYKISNCHLFDSGSPEINNFFNNKIDFLLLIVTIFNISIMIKAILSYFSKQKHCLIIRNKRCDLKKLQGIDLSNMNLSNIEIRGSKFTNSILNGTKFNTSILQGSMLNNCHLISAKFKESNLTYVNFSNSDLRGANFSNSNLYKTDFTGCNLEGANFTNAKFDITTNFTNANLNNIIVNDNSRINIANINVKNITKMSFTDKLRYKCGIKKFRPNKTALDKRKIIPVNVPMS